MRRLAVLVAALALALAPPRAPRRRRCTRARTSIEDARTGEVLASSHANEQLPIASITKLMTVLRCARASQADDVVTVDRRAAIVGESTIELRSGRAA